MIDGDQKEKKNKDGEPGTDDTDKDESSSSDEEYNDDKIFTRLNGLDLVED